MMSSLTLQDILLKVNYFKQPKNLKNLNLNKMYEKNLIKMKKDFYQKKFAERWFDFEEIKFNNININELLDN